MESQRTWVESGVVGAQLARLEERRGWRLAGGGEAVKALAGQQGFEFCSNFLSADSEGHFHQHAGLVRSLIPFQRAIKKTTTICLLFLFIEV